MVSKRSGLAMPAAESVNPAGHRFSVVAGRVFSHRPNVRCLPLSASVLRKTENEGATGNADGGMQKLLSTIIRNRSKIADGLRFAAYLVEQLQNPSTPRLKNAKVKTIKTVTPRRRKAVKS